MNQPLDYPEYFDYPTHEWGHASPTAPGESWIITFVRATAGVLGCTAALLWVGCTFMVLSSLYSTDPGSDPHGYGVVFGTLFGVPSGVVFALLLPLVFAKSTWARAYLIAIPSFAAILALQFLAMYLS